MRHSTRKNTRSRKYNYYSTPAWRKKSLQLAAEIDKYMDIAETQHHINKIIDFGKLEDAVKHLKEIDQLLSIEN